MGIVSGKSLLKSPASSWARACRAMTKEPRLISCNAYEIKDILISIPSKAWSTFTASFALVSKYGMPPRDWQYVIARFEDTWDTDQLKCRRHFLTRAWPTMRLLSSTSTLFPRTTFLLSVYRFIWKSETIWLDKSDSQKENSQGPSGWPVLETRPANYQEYRNFSSYWRHIRAHNSRRHGRRQLLVTEIAPGRLYPITAVIIILAFSIECNPHKILRVFHRYPLSFN